MGVFRREHVRGCGSGVRWLCSPFLLPPRTRRSDDARELAAMTPISHDRMTLSITRPRNGAVDYVEIIGDVDLSDAEELARAAARLHDGAGAGVCVDLGGTTFMDSTLMQFLEAL